MTNPIQTARQSRNWTVADLAARVGVSPRTVEGWEQGKRPSATARIVLEQTLGIRIRTKRKKP